MSFLLQVWQGSEGWRWSGDGRPYTRRNWDSMQITFVQFCQKFGVDWSRPSLDDVGAFVELLVRSSKSLGSIKNYVSAIRAFLHEKGASDSAGLLASPGWGVRINILCLQKLRLVGNV